MAARAGRRGTAWRPVATGPILVTLLLLASGSLATSLTTAPAAPGPVADHPPAPHPTPTERARAPAAATNLSWVNVSDYSPSAPPCAEGGALAYDAALYEFVYYGGSSACTGLVRLLNSTWVFSNGTWSNVSGSLHANPGDREGMAASYDPALGGIVAFGGLTQAERDATNTTWLFNGTWTNLTQSFASSPPALAFSSMVYDPALGTVLLVNGAKTPSIPVPPEVPVNGTWSLSGTGWHAIATTGEPPTACSVGLTYDAAAGGVLLVGGDNLTVGAIVGTWLFNNSTWEELHPETVEPAVAGAPLFYDAAAGYPVLYGGSGNTNVTSGTWAYKNGTWWNISAQVTDAPGPLALEGAAWDPNGEWEMLVGGVRNTLSTSDGNATWSFPYEPAPYALLNASPTSFELGATLSLATHAYAGPGTQSFAYSGLPTGCVSQDEEAFSCVPAEAGSFDIQVSVTAPDHALVVTDAEITVIGPLHAFLSVSNQTVLVGSQITFTASSSGGSGWVSYYYVDLPEGCSTANTSSLTCSPDSAGFTTVYLQVYDELGQFGETTGLPVTVYARLSVGLDVYPLAINLGSSATYTTQWTGGQGGFSFEYSGLPPGCQGNDQATVECIPNATGNFTSSVEVTDSLGQSASASATLEVRVPTSLPTYDFPVVFEAQNLPSTLVWEVELDDAVLAARATEEIEFNLTNGTYSYHVLPPSGYTASPSGGSIRVDGYATGWAIDFAPTGSSPPPPGGMGLPTGPPEPGASWFAGVGAVAAATLFVVLAVARWRVLPPPGNRPRRGR
jgi:hypothetical protein